MGLQHTPYFLEIELTSNNISWEYLCLILSSVLMRCVAPATYSYRHCNKIKVNIFPRADDVPISVKEKSMEAPK
jgi:hypothetical protein